MAITEKDQEIANSQELFESAGPQMTREDFDAVTYLNSNRNSEGVLVPEDFDFSPYVPREMSILLSNHDNTYGLTYDYYDLVKYSMEGFFGTLKVSHPANYFRQGEEFTAMFDGVSSDQILVFGDFPSVSVGDSVFSDNDIGGRGNNSFFGGTVELWNGSDLTSEFYSDLVGFSEMIFWVPPRETAAGKTYVSTAEINDLQTGVMTNISTYGGDDVIDISGAGDTSFINGGDGIDTILVETDSANDGIVRKFGDFILANGTDSEISHVFFDIEKIQLYGSPSNGSFVKTFNVENLGPSVDGGSYTFYEDFWNEGQDSYLIPASFGENIFVVPDSVDQYSSSSVTDFTAVTKNFEDISGEDADDNRKSFEVKGSFSYSGENGYDTNGNLIQLSKISGKGTQIDAFWGEILLSSDRNETALYSDWLFQDKYFANGGWQVSSGHGDDVLVSLNGIATNGFNLDEEIGLGLGTGTSDRMFGYAGNDYLFGGLGDDYIDGGEGVDVAIFLGKFEDYNITSNQDGTYRVTHVGDQRPSDGTDTLVNIESLSFLDQDVALGSNNAVNTIITAASQNSISNQRIDLSEIYDGHRSGLSSAPKLPSLMDAASSGVSSPSSTTSSTDATGSSVGGSTLTDTSDSGIAADTVSFVRSAANEKFTAAAGKVKMAVGGRKEDFTISKVGDSGEWNIAGTGIGTDTLSGFKRLEFEDGVLALDTDPGDTAGQAYRLYQAAFARVPDMPGVAYHMNDMESNGLSVVQIARNFIASPEFKTQYGEDPTEDEYINLLYQNVLGRTPGQFEIDYYKERFESGTTDWNTTLVFFAESPENVSLVAPQIEDGIWMPF